MKTKVSLSFCVLVILPMFGLAQSTKSALDAEFVLIPAGAFMMGSPESEGKKLYLKDDETLHQVTITRAFEMQTTEVTQLQYVRLMKENPSKFKERKNCPDSFTEMNFDGRPVRLCPQHPVENITRNEARNFINLLNTEQGLACKTFSEAIKTPGCYRLPTEAEWEYAARAGTQTARFFGDSDADLAKYAWYNDSSEQSGTHDVKLLSANPFGLYDIYGNVWEWVQDRYGQYSEGAQQDPTGPGPSKDPTDDYNIFRGGSFFNVSSFLRSAHRHEVSLGYFGRFVGFRLVRTK